MGTINSNLINKNMKTLKLSDDEKELEELQTLLKINNYDL